MNEDKFVMSITVNMKMLDEGQMEGAESVYDGLIKILGTEPDVKLDTENETITYVINLPEES